MEQTEIQERNKQIAIMLNFKYKNQNKYWARYPLNNNSFLFQLGYVMMCNLKFHSDWNWIHEAAEFVYSKLEPADSRRFDLVAFIGKNSKEKAFLIISDFAKLCNEKKL